jgi:hypothetical protein
MALQMVLGLPRSSGSGSGRMVKVFAAAAKMVGRAGMSMAAAALVNGKRERLRRENSRTG